MPKLPPDPLPQALALVAHELHTPLMLMKHYAEMIKDSEGAEKNQFAQSIEDLSQELIDSSRFMLQHSANGGLDCQTNAKSINLHEFITRRADRFRPLLQQKKIRFQNQTDPDFSVTIAPECLRILLNNLLGNAIKFTPAAGGITITNQGQTVNILDTAPPLSAADSQAIFQPFHKNHDALNHGFGLGLHICQLVVKSWNGKIWVDSSNDGGNKFCFTLPSA